MIMPLHSSLGEREKLCFKKQNKKKVFDKNFSSLQVLATGLKTFLSYIFPQYKALPSLTLPKLAIHFLKKDFMREITCNLKIVATPW